MDPKKIDNTNNTTTEVELVEATIPKPIPELERSESINFDDVVDATTNVDTPIDVDGLEPDDTKKRKLKFVVWNHFNKKKKSKVQQALPFIQSGKKQSKMMR
ncbi:hypothetical protein QYF36_020869 [Acer negundo]|nr:hypothetical protein QYF36_020869 [Acer negundo]